MLWNILVCTSLQRLCHTTKVIKAVVSTRWVGTVVMVDELIFCALLHPCGNSKAAASTKNDFIYFNIVLFWVCFNLFFSFIWDVLIDIHVSTCVTRYTNCKLGGYYWYLIKRKEKITFVTRCNLKPLYISGCACMSRRVLFKYFLMSVPVIKLCFQG